MNNERKRTLSWNPGADPETEDRAAFLKLSSLERWNYIMAIVLATYPARVALVVRRQLPTKSAGSNGSESTSLSLPNAI